MIIIPGIATIWCYRKERELRNLLMKVLTLKTKKRIQPNKERVPLQRKCPVGNDVLTKVDTLRKEHLTSVDLLQRYLSQIRISIIHAIKAAQQFWPPLRLSIEHPDAIL